MDSSCWAMPPAAILCSFASAITAVPALCWLLEIPPAAPKFDAAAAEALGVPPGPLRGELARASKGVREAVEKVVGDLACGCLAIGLCGYVPMWLARQAT